MKNITLLQVQKFESLTAINKTIAFNCGKFSPFIAKMGQ